MSRDSGIRGLAWAGLALAATLHPSGTHAAEPQRPTASATAQPTSPPALDRLPAAPPQPTAISTEPLPLPSATSTSSQPVLEPESQPGAVVAEAGDAPATTLKIDLPPGRVLQPIDLVNTLRLAGARNIDIAIAKQQINQALADLGKARALWLPSIFFGPTFYRADGQIQTVTGEVRNINRNSLYIGGLAATANGFAAPSPGTGYPAVNGMASVLRFSDAIYEPMAARRDAEATRANLTAQTNDALLKTAEAYFNLQLASGRLAIAREAVANAELLEKITGAYAESGQGKSADHHRVLAELNHQRKSVRLLVGQLQVASTELVRLLLLDPKLIIAPVEPAETVIHLIPDDEPIEDLLAQAFQGRPELAQYRELLNAAAVRLKQARLRPLIPSLGLTLSGGGFGGGNASFFGNFGARSDEAVSLFWELHNLGFGDWAIMRRKAADREVANLQLIKMVNQVAADVAASYETRSAATLQIEESKNTVAEAVESFKLNVIDLRQGANLPRATRPIEVLQPIQALVQARTDYLESVLAYNRAQFQLKRAIGQRPE
jgi:outer membrane protein TolC